MQRVAKKIWAVLYGASHSLLGSHGTVLRVPANWKNMGPYQRCEGIAGCPYVVFSYAGQPVPFGKVMHRYVPGGFDVAVFD